MRELLAAWALELLNGTDRPAIVRVSKVPYMSGHLPVNWSVISITIASSVRRGAAPQPRHIGQGGETWGSARNRNRCPC